MQGEAERALAYFLDDFGESRTAWPLWTYERGHTLRTWSWSHVDLWPERLQWAQRIVYASEVVLLTAAAKAKALDLGPWHPISDRVAVVSTWPIGVARVGFGFRARVLGLFLSMAWPDISDAPSQDCIPSAWNRNAWLDDRDTEQLGGYLLTALLRKRTGDHGNDLPVDTLLGRFIRANRAAGSGDHRASGEQSKRMALEYCREAKLLTNRSGGRQLTLESDSLRQLVAEADEIIEAVNEWEPSAVQQEAVARLLELDRANAGEQIDPIQLVRIEREKRRQGSANHDLALLLRFPFLTRAEIGAIRESCDGLGLVKDRMLAKVTRKTLRNRMAQSD